MNGKTGPEPSAGDILRELDQETFGMNGNEDR